MLSTSGSSSEYFGTKDERRASADSSKKKVQAGCVYGPFDIPAPDEVVFKECAFPPLWTGPGQMAMHQRPRFCIAMYVAPENVFASLLPIRKKKVSKTGTMPNTSSIPNIGEFM
jgi:hypothetical protein